MKNKISEFIFVESTESFFKEIRQLLSNGTKVFRWENPLLLRKNNIKGNKINMAWEIHIEFLQIAILKPLEGTQRKQKKMCSKLYHKILWVWTSRESVIFASNTTRSFTKRPDLHFIVWGSRAVPILDNFLVHFVPDIKHKGIFCSIQQ